MLYQLTFRCTFIKAIFVSAKEYIICGYVKPLRYVSTMKMLVKWGGGLMGKKIVHPSIHSAKGHNLEYSSKLDCFISCSIAYSEISICPLFFRFCLSVTWNILTVLRV
jgi:hypothetical protein